MTSNSCLELKTEIKFICGSLLCDLIQPSKPSLGREWHLFYLLVAGCLLFLSHFQCRWNLLGFPHTISIYLLQYIRTQLSRVKNVFCSRLLEGQMNSELLWGTMLSDGQNAEGDSWDLSSIPCSALCLFNDLQQVTVLLLSQLSFYLLRRDNETLFFYKLLGADE